MGIKNIAYKFIIFVAFFIASFYFFAFVAFAQSAYAYEYSNLDETVTKNVTFIKLNLGFTTHSIGTWVYPVATSSIDTITIKTKVSDGGDGGDYSFYLFRGTSYNDLTNQTLCTGTVPSGSSYNDVAFICDDVVTFNTNDWIGFVLYSGRVNLHWATADDEVNPPAIAPDVYIGVYNTNVTPWTYSSYSNTDTNSRLYALGDDIPAYSDITLISTYPENNDVVSTSLYPQVEVYFPDDIDTGYIISIKPNTYGGYWTFHDREFNACIMKLGSSCPYLSEPDLPAWYTANAPHYTSKYFHRIEHKQASNVAGETVIFLDLDEVPLRASSTYYAEAFISNYKWMYSIGKGNEVVQFSVNFNTGSTTVDTPYLDSLADDELKTVNTALLDGTATSSGIFADCTLLDFSFYDCVIIPVQKVFVPSENDLNELSNFLPETLKDNFPFNYMYLTTAEEGGYVDWDNVSSMYSTSSSVTGFDMSFDIGNEQFATKTITLLDTDDFNDLQEDIPFLGHLYTFIEYALHVTFLFFLYGYIRRIIPKPETA